MAIIKPDGLKGLKGINYIPKDEYDSFMDTNRQKIAAHNYDPVYINNLYSNKLFIDKYGIEKFRSMPNIDARNTLYRNDIINEEWENRYSSLGAGWNSKYGRMTPEAKLEVMESDWLTPTEFEENWKQTVKGQRQANWFGAGLVASGGTAASAAMSNPYYNYTTPGSENVPFSEEEGLRQRRSILNDRVLENIYERDIENRIPELQGYVYEAKANPEIVGRNDEETEEMFKQAIMPNVRNGNYGIPEYASHYGLIENEGISSEMKDFTIDEMRDVLAKKAVYETYMPADMASTALNNEAKRYITDHQGYGKKALLFGNDVLISAASYNMDKVTGFYNLGLSAVDAFSDKPIVYVDDAGKVLAKDDKRIVKGMDGEMYYQDEDGNTHAIHQEQISRSALFNMGKNADGSDVASLFNPRDWTKREMYGVWDIDLANQYEKIGSSPYKVSYNPGEDTDLMYEGFKMMSFGLADMAATLVPFGIGAAGKALSTTSKFGRLAGSVSRFLTAENKAGQLAQAYLGGLSGAVGIAQAYQRGAFQETLEKNLADLEESTISVAQKNIVDRYNSDTEYKAQIDTEIARRIEDIKQQQAQQYGERGYKIINDESLDQQLYDQVSSAVIDAEVQREVSRLKGEDRYAQAQERAINSAGMAAINTFLPEAAKYSLVNMLGHRKFLFTNPTSVVQRASRNFNGIREITTSAGRKRLTTNAVSGLTRADKWKRLGKVTANQVWGGAWTNGTDDMMVDAAERINEDSFNQYLDSYKSGEALSDTYGFIDGLYSYWKGLNNSLGQETTWNAAAVGGLGSTITGNIHFANIATLATKEGRQGFKNNFLQRYKRDSDGLIIRGEDGKPVIEKVNLKDNWRDRLGFFIQNGILNDYYGAKQNDRNLQEHADYVNQILDDNEDFDLIEKLVASDIGMDNAIDLNDEKTMRFVHAFNTMAALEALGNSEKDPATLSSVVQSRKALIDRASVLGTEEDNDFTPEELESLIGQYYSNNAIPQSDRNNELALQNIGKNARKLKEAYDAFNNAKDKIQSIEEERGVPIASNVKYQMMLSQALNNHWEDRINSMHEELGINSLPTEDIDSESLIASYGGKKRATSQLKYYDTVIAGAKGAVANAANNVTDKLEIYNRAQTALRNAQDSNDIFEARQSVEAARIAYEEAVAHQTFLEEQLHSVEEKKSNLEDALGQWEAGNKSKILSADEILALEPVARARMMASENRDMYSARQQQQIVKLESRLKNESAKGDPLAKIQDIAILTQNIRRNEDAYNRMSNNPEAAAYKLESMRREEAEKAVVKTNYNNAYILSDYLNAMTAHLIQDKVINKRAAPDLVYKALRVYNPTILKIIDEEGWLGDYQGEVMKARQWGDVLSDISAVVNNLDADGETKNAVLQTIDGILSNVDNKDSIIQALESAIDNGNAQADVLDRVLSGMETVGYSRDAVVIENREKRKAREAEEKIKAEEAKKKADEAAKAAADKAKAEIQSKPVERKNDNLPVGGTIEVMPLVTPNVNDIESWDDVESVNNNLNIPQQKPQISEQEIKVEAASTETPSQPQGNTNLNVPNASAISTLNKALESEVTNFGKGENTVVLDSMSDNSSTVKMTPEEYKESERLMAMITRGVGNRTDISNQQKALGKKIRDRIKLEVANGDYSSLVSNQYYTQQENKSSESSVNDNMHTGHNDIMGDYVYSESPSTTEQLNEAAQGSDIVIQNSPTDNDIEIENSKRISESEDEGYPYLSGVAIPRYDIEGLKNHRIIEREGEQADDNMNRFFSWMEAAGIKYQNIIDDELPQIIANDPQTPIKFMKVKYDKNATHDDWMHSHLMLVVDYNDNINKGITSIHNEENGGVIESDGNKYLIVGVVGYGKKGDTQRFSMYRTLYDKNMKDGHQIQVKAYNWFQQEEHKNETYYVEPDLYTKVVPGTLIPGWLITSDNKNTKISELINNPEANPHNLNFNTLGWSIIEYEQNLAINTNGKEVMYARNTDTNAGRVFVLIPAGNGKLISAKINALYYNDASFNKNSQLYQELQNLLMQLTAPTYDSRYQALLGLLKLLYLNPDGGHNILLSKEKDIVTLVNGGEQYQFHVDNLDRQKFMEAVEKWNPRINITANVLSNPAELVKYDEAGALTTDLAKLGTAGVNYGIYGLDTEGKLIKPSSPDWVPPRAASESDYVDSHRLDIHYLHGSIYSYNRDTGEYLLNGVKVTDKETLKGLDYARVIIDNGLVAADTKNNWKYYVISSGEQPVVVKQNGTNNKIVEASTEETNQIMDELRKREEAAQKLKAIEEELKNQTHSSEEDNMQAKIDGNEGNNNPSISSDGSQKSYKVFRRVIRGKDRAILNTAIVEKWPLTAQMKPSAKEAFLIEQGVKLETMPESPDELKAWIHNNIECK